MRVEIYDTPLRQLERDCISRFPEEACGLLIGQVSDSAIVITEAAPLANVSTGDRVKSFALDPAAQIAFQRSLRSRKPDQSVVGHYHSHPGGAAEPSDTDWQMVSEADVIWLIVGVDGNQETDMRAFRPGPDGFQGLELSAIDVTPSQRGR